MYTDFSSVSQILITLLNVLRFEIISGGNFQSLLTYNNKTDIYLLVVITRFR